jgi:hypothetical protein
LELKTDASADEVRSAYRRLARIHHPDASGGAPSPKMAELNEAWRVLSDPARRAMYDAQLRGITITPRSSAPTSKLDEEIYPVEQRHRHGSEDGPPAFPWKLIGSAVIVAMCVGFVVSGVSNRGASTKTTINPIIGAGDCVDIQPDTMVKKVSCAGPHEAVVQRLINFDSNCPLGTDPHNDPQGMGIACVIPA